MHLLIRVERYIRRSATSATRFGREALGDPNLVRDLRRGRDLRPDTVRRLAAFLSRAEQALAERRSRR
jgi:2,4-dienoyl-CoA reductase-like NADH-dependent reductase (Old Yellow Enzyme family)